MHPKNIKIDDYIYDLPDERIARYPLAERDRSKLLVYRNQSITEDIYLNIASYLPANALMVFNNTKVIPARLLFNNTNGARIEIFCLEPAEENRELTTLMNTTGSVTWKCLVGRAAKWKEPYLELETPEGSIKATMLEKRAEHYLIRFEWRPDTLTFAEMLDQMGVLPIPPYLKRETESIDQNRYQTLYAKHKGSVAAPTAGLHFTTAVFDSLNKRGVRTTEVTLHVGAGTFKPVKTETIEQHEMHAEFIDVSADVIKQLMELHEFVVAVGTTSLRTIESLYWMGVKAHQQPESSINELEVKQWDPYELKTDLTSQQALQSLLLWMKKNNNDRIVCKTQVLIAPPYHLRVAKALATNFHQPASTLLLLVAAITGNQWRAIYTYALEHDFRFLSYGDGCLLFTNTN